MKETVTISLDTYKRMEEKIKNLEQGIDDLKNNKELVTWQRGMFAYSYWFHNPTEKTIEIIKEMNTIARENDRLRSELEKASKSKFYRFLLGE